MKRPSTVLPFLFFLVLAFASRYVAAQVGPNITSPVENATIVPGQDLKIEYEYQNLGTGNYMVDIALWLDPSATELLYTIVENYTVSPGNSEGVTLNFTNTASYTWKVPHNLITPNNTEGIVYLNVRELTQTKFIPYISLRSFAIMLHVNAAASHLPASYLFTFFLSLAVLCISSL
ncbi:hypothetical protein EC973_001176 [Apophysomyces ossiformis]|uniref:Translocon-associated protein subunit beta n=1 Tax=Apophysomyces ossiformis TaxID=679940 RepID=A0A8H7BU39_9FUNG|nr:hypothetical protein EC973_001176 [Apophysomyces ossiformis]